MRKTLALVIALGATAIIDWRGSAAGITVSFASAPAGNVFAAGGDYATDVLGDAWDMNALTDLSIDPAQRQYWSNLTTLDDSANGAPTAIRGTWNGTEGLSFLFKGHYAVINNFRNGRTSPIDTTVYRKIAFKMRAASAQPAVWWSHRPYSDPAGEGLGAVWNFGPGGSSSYKVYAADLSGPFNCGSGPCTTGTGYEAWTSSSRVAGLRIDPVLGGSNEQVSFDWVRLTASDDAPGSAMQTVQWTPAGAATVTVEDGSGSIYTVSCAAAMSSSCRWNYGILPPGTYTVRVASKTTPGVDGTMQFRINTPPKIQVISPSTTSGEDYATRNQPSPWDMHDPADLDDDLVIDHLEAKTFNGTELVATSDGVCLADCSSAQPTGDANVYLLSNNEQNNRGTIDTNKYRYLSFNMQLERAYNLFAGSVGRIMWGHTAAVDTVRHIPPWLDVAVTEPFIVWPGSNRYTFDLASLAVASDKGILPSPYSPTPSTWTSAVARQLRIDPHEFAERVTFHLSDVKLTAMSRVTPGGAIGLAFTAVDLDTSDSVSVQLFYDTDTNAASGLTPIATLTGAAVTAGTYTWDTTGVPAGVYYIYARASDGRNTSGVYSSAPLAIQVPTAGPPNPAMGLDSPVNGATLGTSFNVSGWAIDSGAAAGTGVDAIHVYAAPTSGAPSTFLGAASYGGARTDIGALFGSQFTNSGFSLAVSGLAPGSYQIIAYAHSAISNSFSIATAANVTVRGPVSQPLMSLDGPQTGATVGSTVTFAGWAVDVGSATGTGVDAIHVWAYPTNGAPAQFVGVATYGIARPDIGGAFGTRYTNSGYRLSASVAPGTYRFVAFAHSTVANTFNASAGADNVTVQSTNTNAVLFVDAPAQGAVVTRPFTISGWAVDSGAATGTGINAIHVWAFPTSGAPGFLVGVAAYGNLRQDIGTLFGASRFANSGFTFTVNASNLATGGTYDLIVFGRSTVTGGFTVARVVRVTVQ